MDTRSCTILFLVFLPIIIDAWRNSREERYNTREYRKGIHYHSKRHMMPKDDEAKRRSTTQRTKEVRRRVKVNCDYPTSGHLTPLEEDDIDNDEVISVAIGPQPMRHKYEKVSWKFTPKPPINNTTNCTAANLVRDVLSQLGKEFLTHQVSEDFVFGQYVGNAMRNLTGELRLKMQHEILELVVKYQRLNRGDALKKDDNNVIPVSSPMKMDRRTGGSGGNETDETWPDFSNLAKIVG